MNMMKRTTGNALVVVIVLLLLASLMGLFALNAGVLEQRASGNDVRAKVVGEVAEAGLAQGMEFLKANSGDLVNPANGKWVPCGADETAFPCGSVVKESMVQLFDPVTKAATGSVTVPRRSTMYYWKSVGYDFDGSGGISGWEERMLPLIGTLDSVNGFPAKVGVGVVLCRVAFKANTEDPTLCTDDPLEMSPTSVATLVSVGSLPGEKSRATLTQSIGVYNILNNPPGKPPVIASGSVDISGGLQVVTNPNAAGPGVPVSVWTRKDMEKHGTPNTCYLDEFLRFGAQNSSPPIFEGESDIVTCDTCQCPAVHSISYQSSGNLQLEGIDILDNEGAATQEGINYNVKPEEFPCDLFLQVFGVAAWEDADGDNFCETKLTAKFKNPNTGIVEDMGADEAFLYTNALKVIPAIGDAGAAATARLKPEQIATAAYLNADASGLVWCQANCNVGSGQQVGSPDHPVLLVIDGAATIQGRVFGMIFMRSTEDELSVDTGGNATLDMNAGASVYGSVVVQGQINKANGTAAIVYNGDVLSNLANDPSNNKFGGIPGGWADHRVTY